MQNHVAILYVYILRVIYIYMYNYERKMNLSIAILFYNNLLLLKLFMFISVLIYENSFKKWRDLNHGTANFTTRLMCSTTNQPQQPNELISKLNQNLSLIFKCSRKNALKLNPQKIEMLCVGTTGCLTQATLQQSSNKIRMDNVVNEVSNTAKNF